MKPESGWRPQREVEILAGTPPGGGLDRAARALAAAIEARKLLDVPVKVVNIPGDGARKVWRAVDERRGDAHVLCISSPNLTSDNLTGVTTFDHDAYTPLAILCTEYIAFVVRADSPLKSGSDLLAKLGKDAAGVTVALATALGNPNHIALAQVVRHAGGDMQAPKIRVFDSAIDAVADVVAGNADVGAVTAASALKALAESKVRTLAVSAPGRLAGPFAQAPTWIEQSVPCVIGAWRGASGPAGLTVPQAAYWERALAAATASPQWAAELGHYCWAPAYRDGAPLREALARERADMRDTLGALGLLR
ncbi:MAG: tripartite tricarboxylate transporter substrate-binding protein [Pseudomonadota bacterium]